MLHLSRRSFAWTGATAVLWASLAHRADAATEAELARLEAAHGGRLGVAVFERGSGRGFGYRAAETFPMCSTYKFLAVAAILARVDRGALRLDQRVPFSATDILPYAPITRAHLAEGAMTLGALCAAALQWSDNTAANLLLARIGGPAGWTRYARSIGDAISRLDRTEPTLNTAIPGDPRDTTSPSAMLGDLQAVLLGSALSRSSRQQLEDWMLGGTITGPLLKAGVPKDWRVADKSGAGAHGTRNDIGILLPPKGASVLAAVYYTGSAASMPEQNAVIAAVARMIAQRSGGT
jgi:beta-lactamase class A